MSDTAKDRKQACYAALKEAVLTMQLRPGADLDESKLCDEFGLSRTPLRDLFQILAGEGFVDLRANRGARVSDLTYETLRAFFLAAPMIYAAISRLAAAHRTDAQISKLQSAQDRFVDALSTGDIAARSLTNNAFHDVTGEMAHNQYLLPSFRRLLIDHARIGMTFYQMDDGAAHSDLQTAAAHHDAMIAAIRARDQDAAGALAEAHWNLSRHEIERFVSPAPLDIPLGQLDPIFANGDARDDASPAV